MSERASVKLEDFLRVVIAERDKYPTVADAAAALGMTAGSFKQRLVRERKRYPKVFATVPHYSGNRGPRTPDESEVEALVAKIMGEKDE